MIATPPISIDAQASRLLHLAGLTGDAIAVVALPGGRNNRVFRIDSAAGTYLLKRYFHHPRDARDRLAHESAFLAHLERSGCRSAPRLLATLAAEHAALLEFVEGKPLQLDQVDTQAVAQASEFFHQANVRPHSLTASLPHASEACFSIAQHLATTQRRVDRLDRMLVNDEVDVAAAQFVRNELVPAWASIRSDINGTWPSIAERETELPAAERCLSPSDFGFHNALCRPDGRLCFVDFEYAGWDDPAKLICDFANQPDLLLPRALSAQFQRAVVAANADPAALLHRIAALEPLYQLKWACICLNDFLDTGRSRRIFTGNVRAAGDRARREFQLSRANLMLARATASQHQTLGHGPSAYGTPPQFR